MSWVYMSTCLDALRLRDLRLHRLEPPGHLDPGAGAAAHGAGAQPFGAAQRAAAAAQAMSRG